MTPLDAARGAVGARFRLHGRDPETGLDCVGLAAVALRAGGRDDPIPSGYALRGGDAATIGARIDAMLARTDRPAPGDLLLYSSGPGQLHLAIRSEGGVIHADAGLRRVVERPGEPPWRLIGAWTIEKAGRTGGDPWRH